MQYGQIVFLLFVAMVFYYAAMIFMDLQRAKAAQNAEQDSHKEEDIDISEEARSFRPIRINRDEPDSKEGNPQQDNAENPDSNNESNNTDGTEKSARGSYFYHNKYFATDFQFGNCSEPNNISLPLKLAAPFFSLSSIK